MSFTPVNPGDAISAALWNNTITEAANVVSNLGYVPVNNAVVGATSGIATLDGTGKLTSGQIPTTVPYATSAGSATFATNAGSANSATSANSASTATFASMATSSATAAALEIARTIAVAGDITGNASFDGSANISITATLGATGVTAGTYTQVVVNSKGLVVVAGQAPAVSVPVQTVFGRTGNVVLQSSDVTGALGFTPAANAAYLLANQTIAMSGDATGSGTNAIAVTLATVNTNVGSFGGATVVPAVTVNAKGLVTAVANTNIAFPVTSVFGRTGAVTLGSSDVTVALGFTPMNAANALVSNQNITVSGDATGSGTNAISLTLASVGTAGTYGNSGSVAVITTDAKGRVTAVTNTAISFPVTTVAGRTGAITLSASDISGVQASLGFTPLNTANASVALTGDATGTATFSGNAVSIATTLAASGATAGVYGGATVVPAVTVNAKGLVTAVANTNIAFPVTSVFGRTGAVILQSSDVTGALGFTPVNNAVVGAASGVATLDSSGRLTAAQIPSGIVGAIVYQGTWDAFLNAPALANSTGTKGYLYKVANAGTTNINGTTQWNVGDEIVFDGTVWDKIDGLQSVVVSVAGRTGAVSLSVSDISGAQASLGFAPLNSANASVALTGDATGTATFSGNAVSVAATLAASGATAGVYGGATVVPAVTVNAKGLVTAVSNTNISFPVTTVFGRAGAVVLQSSDVTGALGFTPAANAAYLLANQTIVVSGDATGSGTNAVAVTLASVGTAGTYGNSGSVAVITTDAKGRVTAVTNTAISFPVTTVFGRAGAVVLQSSDVTGALGFTPLNTANASVALTGDATGTATFSGNAVSVATTLASVGTAGTYGNSGSVAVITTDAKGRVTAVTPTAIAFPITSVAGRGGAVTLSVSDVANAAPLASPTFTGTATHAAGTFTTTLGVAGQTSLAGMSATSGTFTTQLQMTASLPAADSTANVATTAWVAGKNYQASLGFTPLNQANASVTLTGPITGSATFSTNAVSVATSLISGTFSGAFGVTGTTTLTGMSATTGTFSTSLGVTGTGTFTSTLGVAGLATLSGGLVATNGSFATGTFSTSLGVTALTASSGSFSTGTFNSTLGVGGTTTLGVVTATTGTFSTSLTVGSGSTNSGTSSAVIGASTTNTQNYSVVGGYQASNKRYGAFVTASGQFANAGDAQQTVAVMRATSAATTAVRFTADGAAAGSANVMNLQSNSVMALTIHITGRDTVSGSAGMWEVSTAIKMAATASTAAVIGTAEVDIIALDTAWAGGVQAAPTVTADTTNGGLNLSIVPNTANTCHWVARVIAVEVI